jgi:2-keto-4-pentenoate hydratase/2-oxohepta-3-ene-1,7-dioic acid hydratase in catechol pathway
MLIVDIADLIVRASYMYALHPGDVIMTGTPEGVGPIKAGGVMRAEIEGIGAMEVKVS